MLLNSHKLNELDVCDRDIRHLELHVVSRDLIGKYRNPIQYNSFHPDLGYFLHLQDVLDYFDAVESSWLQVWAVYLDKT